LRRIAKRLQKEVRSANRIGIETLEDRTLLSGTPTALDAYITAPDPAYQFSLNSTITGPGYTDYVINMISQTWRSPSEVNKTVWQHWLQIIVPTTVKSHTDVLEIGGGSNGAAPTAADSTGVLTATTLGAITTVLPTVPNEPLTFAGQTQSFTEDQIIAYSFQQFLNGGDQNWPLLLPMVKSAVKAMDTTQSFITSQSGGSLQVDNFIVTGASKRGWTTWLTPAVDARVIAIVPFVFDFLNQAQQVPNLKDSYVGVTTDVVGGFPGSVKDYTNDGVFAAFGTPQSQALTQIVDPFSYIDRPGYDIPKYSIDSTGDQFFAPDSAQFYFNQLPGQNYIRYVPNTDHGLNTDALTGGLNFMKAFLDGAQLPQFSWTVTNFGTTINLHTVTSPTSVTMWKATNPNNRDFRLETFGPNWTSSTLTDQGGGNYAASVAIPPTGATAFFIQMTYLVDGVTLTFTTQISEVPLFTPALAVADAGGAFTGKPFAATANANSISGLPIPGKFSFAYYAGSTATGTGSSTPPSDPGTYTVVATFASSDPQYLNGQSAPFTFTITPSLVNNGVLTINGDGNSAITIALSDSGAVDVKINSSEEHFDPGVVTSIVVDGAGGSDSLTVDDTSTASGHTYTLTSTSIDTSGAQPITYADVPAVTLDAGNAGNTIDWQGTASGTFTVFTGTGVNVVNFGDANNTVNSFDGTPVLEGQGSANTVNVFDQGNTTPRHYVLTADAFSPNGGSGFGYAFDIQQAHYYLGSGGNIVDWQGTADCETVTVFTGTGANTINFGDTNNTLDSFLGTPILQGQGKANSVNVFDQGSAAPHTYVIGPNFLTRDGGSGYAYDFQSVTYFFGAGGNTIDWQGDSSPATVYTGTGNNTINFGDANNTLDEFSDYTTLVGQGGTNTVNVYAQGEAGAHHVILGTTPGGAATFQIAGDTGFSTATGVQSINYFGGSGGNSVDWQGVPAGVTMTVHTGTGANTFNFGDANNTLDSFLGTPILQGQGSNNTIKVFDQGSAAPHTYVIGPNFLTRDGGSGYAYDFQSVTYFFGAGGNTIDWQGDSSPSTVYTGTGNNTINFGDANNTLEKFSDYITLVGQGGTNTANVFDQGDTKARHVILGTTTGGAATFQIAGDTGFSTATGVQSINYFGGSGGNTVDWQGVPAGVTMTVHTGTGANTFNFGDANNTLDGFVGDPVLDGEGSNNTVNVYDQGTTQSRAYVITANGLSPNGGKGFGLASDIQQANLFLGSGTNTVDWQGNEPGTAYDVFFGTGTDQVSGSYNAAATSLGGAVSLVGASAAFGALSISNTGALDLAQAATGTLTATSINNLGSITGSGHLALADSGDFSSGNLSLVLGGTTAGTNYDQIQVGGTASLTGSLNLSLAAGFVPTAGEAFTIVTDTAATPIGGTFTGLPQGSIIQVSGVDGSNQAFTSNLQISYTGGNVVLTVQSDATTTSLQSSVNPSFQGQSVTFTATVTSAGSEPFSPGGTVTFLDGTSVLGTGTLTGNVASYTTSALTTANHSITASYGGDSIFGGSTSGAVAQAVKAFGSTTSVTSSANPSVFGQKVTFTATVKSTGTGTPTGTVMFLDGANVIGQGTLSAGKATFSTTTLALNGHSITASYAGNATFTGSASTVLTQTVNPAATTAKVTSSANPSVFGQTVTFTVTITAKTPGAGTPTGTVTIFDGTAVLAMLPYNGSAITFPTSTLSVASHSITAQYGGNADFTASTSNTVIQSVRAAATTTAVTSSLNPSAFGNSVTFTATVSVIAPGTGIPTGTTVTFKDGTKVLGTGTLDINGQATFTTSALNVGSHSITAVYSATTNLKTSTSPAITQVVNVPSNVLAFRSRLASRPVTLAALQSFPGLGGSTAFAREVAALSQTLFVSNRFQSADVRFATLDRLFAALGRGAWDLNDLGLEDGQA
jgi:PhoPQ-activated pathogenicity-related protein